MYIKYYSLYSAVPTIPLYHIMIWETKFHHLYLCSQDCYWVILDMSTYNQSVAILKGIII